MLIEHQESVCLTMLSKINLDPFRNSRRLHRRRPQKSDSSGRVVEREPGGVAEFAGNLAMQRHLGESGSELAGRSASVLQRKPICSCGGSCSGCLEEGRSQAKLAVSPEDRQEQDADRMADAVLRIPGIQPSPKARPEAQQPRSIRTQPLSRKGPSVPSAPISGPNHSHALGMNERRFFEARYGQDLSQVRIHTGPAAAASAQQLNALAYTRAENIVFGHHQYRPHDPTGRHLLAHELAHVIQQRSGGLSLQRQVITRPSELPPEIQEEESRLFLAMAEACTQVGMNYPERLLRTSAEQRQGELEELVEILEGLPQSRENLVAAYRSGELPREDAEALTLAMREGARFLISSSFPGQNLSEQEALELALCEAQRLRYERFLREHGIPIPGRLLHQPMQP